MLRPAGLLPPKRPLTPRSAEPLSEIRLGPATGRTDIYPDGTRTREFAEA
jgi:hypothetical protein